MEHPFTHRRALGVGAAVVLLLTACGDDTSTDAATGLSYDGSPLNAYMGSVWERDPDAEAKAEIQAQEEVAQCMTDQGFDYSIPEAEAPGPFEVGFDQDVMNTESWIAANGFGLAMIWGNPAEPESDPNRDYIASLSEASRAQYYAALYGTYSEGMSDEELASYVPTDAEQGCWGRGEVEGFTPDYIDDPASTEISEGIEKLRSTVEEDPAVVAVNEKWADCMADADFTGYETSTDMLDELSTAYAELYYPDETNATGTASLTPQPEAVAALEEREISTALADHACKKEVGYDDAYLEVLYAAEEQFITDNKSQLDALIAEYGN